MSTKNFNYPLQELVDGSTPYTAAMFQRDWTVTDANLAGALKSIGAGVIRDPNNEFKVTSGNGLFINIQSGKAVVLHSEKGISYLESGFATVYAVEANRSADNPVYVFVAPETSLKDGRPKIVLTDVDVLDGALLLASVTTTNSTATVTDRRAFAKFGGFDIHGLPAKPNVQSTDEVAIWDSSSGDLRKVSLAVLLANAGGQGGSGVTELSQLTYNTEHPVQADEYIDSQFSEIRGELAGLQGTAKFPEQSDLHLDLTAALAVGLFEVNPPAILRTQMSALGRGFGKGQNSTPDFSPDTNAAKEAAYDVVTGLIRP